MWEIVKSGGPLMVPLIGCAVLSLAYTIERLWVFSRLPDRVQAQKELSRIEASLVNGGEDAVVQEVNQGTGVLNHVFAALLSRYDILMLEQREFRETNEEIVQLSEAGGGGQIARFIERRQELADLKEELVVETEEASRSYLGKHLPILNMIGNITPLLGLLGTIIGMILAFESIAAVGTGDPKVVADGISQALVTTASGLIVAIPTIVAYGYLARKADLFLDQVEVFGHAFSNTLITAGRRNKK